MSDPIPAERRHRTDLGSKVKSDAVLILVDTDEAEQEMGGYAAKGFSAVKMRVVGRDGFSVENTIRRVSAARRGIGDDVFDRFEYVPGPEYVF